MFKYDAEIVAHTLVPYTVNLPTIRKVKCTESTSETKNAKENLRTLETRRTDHMP